MPPGGSEETLQVITDHQSVVEVCMKEQSENHTQEPQPRDNKSPGVRGSGPDAKQDPLRVVGLTEGGDEGYAGLLKGPEVLWSKVVVEEEEEEEDEADTEGECSSDEA